MILQAAGLLNITGSFKSALNIYRDSNINANRAFTGVKGGGDGCETGTSTISPTCINFDTHRSSQVYGNSNTVQPANATVCLWKRIN